MLSGTWMKELCGCWLLVVSCINNFLWSSGFSTVLFRSVQCYWPLARNWKWNLTSAWYHSLICLSSFEKKHEYICLCVPITVAFRPCRGMLLRTFLDSWVPVGLTLEETLVLHACIWNDATSLRLALCSVWKVWRCLQTVWGCRHHLHCGQCKCSSGCGFALINEVYNSSAVARCVNMTTTETTARETRQDLILEKRREAVYPVWDNKQHL